MVVGPWSRKHCKQQEPICKSGKAVTVTLDAKAINMQWSVTLSRPMDMLFPLNYCAQDILHVPNPNSTNYHLQARAKKTRAQGIEGRLETEPDERRIPENDKTMEKA